MMVLPDRIELSTSPLPRVKSAVVAGRKFIGWAMKDGPIFETMTITPSIDASASGHWHGFITNGEIR